MSDCLGDHDPNKCLVCNSNRMCNSESSTEIDHIAQNNSQDLFGKISAAVKNKSADFKEKIIDYIVNPSISSENERHVSPKDKVGKLYRNLAPVFSIDDENLPGLYFYLYFVLMQNNFKKILQSKCEWA